MGHKINPTAFRLGVTRDWKSRWFDKKNYREFLEEDFAVRSWLEEKLAKASVESVNITRSANLLSVTIKSARPGLIIGRGGKGLEDLQKGLKQRLTKMSRRASQPLKYNIKLEIEEIKKPDTFARLVAQNVAEQLERRLPFRRVLKQTLEKVINESGVEGIKISVGGRLGGAEIARTEHMSRGKIPLQNLRADIDYAHAEAHTTYGVIGVKVWLYKGDIFADAKG
ncbi:MAG: 30S ribosomal protein S3 [Parcubacteria group bacterium]|nr:30S ribosomal protein S3 [Parcubacteria group bacterium]